MDRLNNLLLIALMAMAAGAAQAARPGGQPGHFDHYIVSLSWSPAFCAANKDPHQCAPGRRLGFVLHGLWPQHEAGYPQHCSTEKLSAKVRDQYAALFPAPRMVVHQWTKHGTCSGLAPGQYFDLSARLQDQLRIPETFQSPAAPFRTSLRGFIDAFNTANPSLPRHAVLPFCSRGGKFLREIRACYSKAGQARTCGAGEIKRSYRSCREPSFLLHNVR
jgi:ribonuclease T2